MLKILRTHLPKRCRWIDHGGVVEHKVGQAEGFQDGGAEGGDIGFVRATADALVPYNQTQIWATALENSKVPVVVQTLEAGGHGGFEGPKLNTRLQAFLDKYLPGADATVESGRLKVRESFKRRSQRFIDVGRPRQPEPPLDPSTSA